MVQFTLGVTTVPVYKKSCRSTMEHLHTLPANVTTDFSFLVLDYSNDNGLTWDTLESWPLVHGDEKRLGVVLPHPARTPATMLRWWQLTRPGFEAQSISVITFLFQCYLIDCFLLKAYFGTLMMYWLILTKPTRLHLSTSWIQTTIPCFLRLTPLTG